MCIILYGHKFKIIAIKRNPVDQSSCNSFIELIDGYQVYKTVPKVVGSEKRSTDSEKSVEWLHPQLLYKQIGLNLWQEAASFYRF